MRGGWLHNQIVQRLASVLLALGWQVFVEHPIRVASRVLFADVYADNGSHTLLLEVELSPDRVHADIEKAIGAEADVLWIVTPEPRLTSAIHRKAVTCCNNLRVTNLRIRVCTYGVAVQRLTDLESSGDLREFPGDIKTRNRSQPGEEQAR